MRKRFTLFVEDNESINLEDQVPCSRCNEVTFMTDDVKRNFTEMNGIDVTGYVCYPCSEHIDGFICDICDEHVEFNDSNWCTVCFHLCGDFPPRYCMKCWGEVGVYDDEHISAHKDCLES
jgi:hypothetical protein